MGFNVTALAQKARTQTLIVDSDLNMGNYDLIATDVRGDTAEFSEFVGGVGNFESGLISGGLDVGDILHAESSMQIDGDLVVEGAINNVNITNEGAISTAKSVTATGGFKGNVTGNVTGSISGGTVAGSKGTFSGAVSATTFNGVSLDANSFNSMPIGLNYTVSTSATNLCGLRMARAVSNFTIAEYEASRFQVTANTAYTIKPLRDSVYGLPISSLPSLPSGASYILKLDFDKTYTQAVVTITSPFNKTETRPSSTASYNEFRLTQSEALLAVQRGITFKNNTSESFYGATLYIKSTNNIFVAAY